METPTAEWRVSGVLRGMGLEAARALAQRLVIAMEAHARAARRQALEEALALSEQSASDFHANTGEHCGCAVDAIRALLAREEADRADV
jgi:NAD(P)-dependent dehydrogenase (short-subunit alcohol dehydrogenase family)